MNNTDRIIIILLALQVGSTAYLWTLDRLDAISQGIFSLFVGVDLLAFAMISYLYRVSKSGTGFSKLWMSVGSILILVLVFSSVFLH